MLSEQETQRICELLARISQYTQQFEREEAEHDNNAEKAQAVGTLQERVSNTRTAHRRPRRTLPQTVNEKTAKEKPTILTNCCRIGRTY